LVSGTNKGDRQVSQAQPTPAWIWLVLIGGFALIFWQFTPKRPGAQPAPAPTSWIWLLVFVPAVVVVVALVALQFIRNYDPGIRRAEKRAAEGDLDGAIADLREQIEEKGPKQNRVNALGIFLMNRERYDEAAAMFRKADAMGEPNHGACRANLGLALLKGGKPAEAIPVLEEAGRTGPQLPVLICVINLHTALALAELLRWDEADERFRRAEDAARLLRKTQRAALEKEIEQCRQKLEQHSAEQPKPEGLAEF
jgi:tetratricopeptide (TPR) repeat protein